MRFAEHPPAHWRGHTVDYRRQLRLILVLIASYLLTLNSRVSRIRRWLALARLDC